MAQYTYDPTQGKVVPLEQANIVTYITSDPGGIPDEQAKKAAAAEAVMAAQRAGIPTATGAGGSTDSQNAARLEAERIAKEKSPYNVRSTAGDELLKKQAAASAAAAGKAAAAAADKKARLELDPDVIAARKLAAEAAAEVAATQTSITQAKANLATTKESNVANQPGKAWTWDGKAWVKPAMPKDGKSYKWNDETGWTIATTSDVATAATEVVPASPGDAYVWNSVTKTWERPPKPAGEGYSWDDDDGWFKTTIIPGSTGGTTLAPGKVLASDTFKNTFALMFGAKEAGQPYVSKLYDLVSGFYKTGSSQEEAMNLAIRQAFNENAIPEFTKRFAGIFALDAKLRAGEAIEVPTIAEFFAAEAKMGDVLREAGMGDVATQEFLGDVIGRGKSVAEVGRLISNAFNTIDNAPQALKDTLQRYYPSASRSELAKAMLLGPEGAQALEKKIKGISVLSAAETQGVKTTLEEASDIAAMGYGYTESLAGFEKVKKLERAGTLAEFGGTDFTQQQAQNAIFASNAAAKAEIERLKQEEENRFSGKAGNIGSKAFASQQRGAGLI